MLMPLIFFSTPLKNHWVYHACLTKVYYFFVICLMSHTQILKSAIIPAISGGLLQLEPATTVWESYCIKLVFSRSALQSAVHTRFNLLPVSLHSHFFFVFLVKHLCFLLCVSSHLVALAGNYHTRPVSKSRLVALIFTLAIFHIWAWKSKFMPINLKQCPAFEQQGRPSRSRTY